jgi:hypothetical protein
MKSGGRAEVPESFLLGFFERELAVTYQLGADGSPPFLIKCKKVFTDLSVV